MTYKDGKEDWSEVRSRFNSIVGSETEYDVAYTDANHESPVGCADGHCSYSEGTRVYIDRSDVGTASVAHKCGGLVNAFRSGTYDLPGLVSHELMGHAINQGTFRSHDLFSFWKYENVYHREHKQAEGCPG